jgi:hypothetical protein
MYSILPFLLVLSVAYINKKFNRIKKVSSIYTLAMQAKTLPLIYCAIGAAIVTFTAFHFGIDGWRLDNCLLVSGKIHATYNVSNIAKDIGLRTL